MNADLVVRLPSQAGTFASCAACHRVRPLVWAEEHGPALRCRPCAYGERYRRESEALAAAIADLPYGGRAAVG